MAQVQSKPDTTVRGARHIRMRAEQEAELVQGLLPCCTQGSEHLFLQFALEDPDGAAAISFPFGTIS